MSHQPAEISPQVYARTGGALYLIIIVLGIFGQVLVRDRLIVPGDIVATSANIISKEFFWRVGIAAELLALICTIGLATIYFVLLRPVSRELNLLATFLRLISIAVAAVSVLNLDAALFPLGNTASLKGFTPEQLDTLTNLAIKSHSHGFSVSLFFLGFCFLVHGYLILRSGFLPKVLGVLIQVAGFFYLTNGLIFILAPAIAGRVFLVVVLPIFVAETALSLWLLIKGVDVLRWKELAEASSNT